jgi:CHAT domain-containing protein
VAERFLTLAYEGRLADLPKTHSADTADFERRVRNTLRVRCVSIEDLRLTPLEGRVTEPAFEARLQVWKTDREDASLPAIADTIVLRLHLLRQEDEWRIARVVDLDEEFAARLLRVPAAERGRLIEEHPAALTKGVVRALLTGALRLLNEGKSSEAGEVLELAREIAIRAGDRGGEAMAVVTMIDLPNRPRESLAAESFALIEGLSEPDVLARVWYKAAGVKSASYWAMREEGAVAARLESSRVASVFAARAEDPTILVRVLYSLGNLTANARADYLSARRYIDRALALAREIGDRTGEMGCETVLATIYLEQGDQDRGLHHHRRALELARELKAVGYPALLLRTACELAVAGRFQEARVAFDSILERRGGSVTTKTGKAFRPFIGEGLRHLAMVEAGEGDLAEAECLIREAGSYFDSAPEAYLYELAPHAMERGDPAKALSLALASLTEQRLYSTQRVNALVAAGRAYGTLGMPDRGLACALEAIELREEIGERVAGDARQRANASSRLADSYELAAQLLLDRGRVSEAFAFLENGRARVLTEVIEHGSPVSWAEVDAGLHREQARLERELVAIRAELDRARGGAATALTNRLEQARAAHASFVDGRLARTARRDSTHRRVDAATLGQLTATLPRGIVAVEYLLLPRQLHVFVIRGDGARIRHRVVNVDQSQVEARVRRFVEMLGTRDLKAGQPARQLYDLVIAPIEADLSNATGVLLIPDKILWRLPFAALVDGGGRHLVERMPIAYAPSLGAYAAMTDARRSAASGVTSLLAIGNPTLAAGARSEATSFYRGVTLGALPDAEREVDGVARLYRDPVVLKGDAATEARAKSLLGQAAVIHFATHGIVDDGNAMYSRLALAAGRSPEEDGWLESWEIARMHLHADVVVLSACETAAGTVYTGEGAVGMTWAFFLAGARSAVASQWNVASASTAGLMIRFHRALRSPAPPSPFGKAEALRAAQLALLRRPSTAHPFHWASFVLIGDTGGTAGIR